MKIIVEYNIDDEKTDDAYDFECFKIMQKMKASLDEINGYCRSELKHGDVSDDVGKVMERIRDMVTESGAREF